MASKTEHDHQNQSHAHSAQGHAHDHGAVAQDDTHKVKDPVCGMIVDPHTAQHKAEHAGRPYYFLSLIHI